MREILFRGKRIDTGEWVYGAFVPDALEQTHGEMVTWGFIRRYQPNRTVKSVEMIEVHRYTIGQYTGLKDKNGREIYEGDILKDTDNEIYYVDFIRGCFYLKTNYKSVPYLGWTEWLPMCEIDRLANPVEFEIVGNIYENPELLG